MKRLIFIALFLLLATICFAGEFEVQTGYGYFKDSEGHIIAKALLPEGTHPIKDGYTYHEVNTQKVLNKIKVWQPPLTQEEAYKKKISKKMRKLAIQALKDEGELPPNYGEN